MSPSFSSSRVMPPELPSRQDAGGAGSTPLGSTDEKLRFSRFQRTACTIFTAMVALGVAGHFLNRVNPSIVDVTVDVNPLDDVDKKELSRVLNELGIPEESQREILSGGGSMLYLTDATGKKLTDDQVSAALSNAGYPLESIRPRDQSLIEALRVLKAYQLAGLRFADSDGFRVSRLLPDFK